MSLTNLTKDWRGRAAAIAMVGLALAPTFAATAANAGERDTRPAAVWTPELRELRAASDAASDYAENNNGVGILFHVGRDLSGRADAESAIQTVADHFIQKFNARNVEAKVFTSMNGDAPATVVTYHIDKLIHGAHNGTEVKGLKTALASIPDVIQQLNIAKSIAAAVNDQQPTGPSGG